MGLVLTLDVVTTAATLYAVALGLLLVFGVLGIMNLAHGAFLTAGAYAAVVVSRMGWNPWVAVVMAPGVGAAVGAVVERCVIRRMYDRPLDAILATWGLNLVVIQSVTLYFGREIQFARSPLEGAVALLGTTYSSYRLAVVVLAVALGAGTWMAIQKSGAGLTARAIVMNMELAEALGVDTVRARARVFCLGAALAALAGALITPLVSIHPYMGVPWLVNSFMLVLVAGWSVEGLGRASLLLGAAQVLVSAFVNPVVGGVVIVLLAVAILRLRETFGGGQR